MTRYYSDDLEFQVMTRLTKDAWDDYGWLGMTKMSRHDEG